MRLIDADKLKLMFLSNVDNNSNFNVMLKIDKMPTEDAQKVTHGEWLTVNRNKVCSICSIAGYGKSNYCPSCGAKMDKKGGV